MEGKGVFIWPNGRRYTGEYKNDLKDGYGEFEWEDKRMYKGMWKEGKQSGKVRKVPLSNYSKRTS